MHKLETVARYCPYCAEPIELVIDCSLATQHYIEDCEVCCRPIDVAVAVANGDSPVVTLSQENEV